MVDEVARARLRYAQIRELLIKTNDRIGLDLLDDLVASCRNYVGFVVSMEHTIKLISFRGEAWEQRKDIETLDHSRKVRHDGLISKLQAFNRYLLTVHDPGSVPGGGIFSLDPDLMKERARVGDWAGYLVSGLRT